MPTPDQRLQDFGIAVPTPAKPVANYVGWVRSGNLVFVAGQLPLRDGALNVKGVLGLDNISVEEAALEARQCALNIIAQVKDACGGNLARVQRVVKLTGMVACTPSFTDHPKVVNGASDFMVQVFGDAGKHARVAVGVASLPLNACVEIDAVVEIV
jgi:enamine deaminase RidA (YjgF/YER057c/UK114 family)